MLEANKPVVLGRIGAPYGLQGWVKVTTYTEAPDTLLDYQTWLVGHESLWQEMTPLEGRLVQDRLLVHFDGIDRCNQARLLVGKDVAIPRADLPETEDGAIYWIDLPGLQVINKGVPAGVVKDIFATGANDVLVVEKADGGEMLVPYIAGVIEKVVLDEGAIYIVWDDD